ncbi:MAG: pyridoxal-phosphate dependent enzyme [Anaerolineae bacterium]
MTELHYYDSSTQETYPFYTRQWRGASGAPLELAGLPPFDPGLIRQDVWSLWRYRALLALPDGAEPVSLGEGMTPLVPLTVDGRTLHFKLEFMAPTGSYKDRGVTTLITGLKAIGVREVLEDSSGNAGVAVAAYAAAGGLKARIFVPDYASPAKKAQVRVYGAELVEVPGGRAATTEAAIKAAETSVYASHAWHPLFTIGLRTAAWEIWEALGRRAPDAVVMPSGQGGLLLGLFDGFMDLKSVGLIDRLPKLYAVQAAAVAPLYASWRAGAHDVAAVPEGRSLAEGVLIRQPVRGAALLNAVRQSEGGVAIAGEEAIQQARADLARHGLFVEPTSALALAGLRGLGDEIPADALVVLPLTGSGLKAPPTA